MLSKIIINIARKSQGNRMKIPGKLHEKDCHGNFTKKNQKLEKSTKNFKTNSLEGKDVKKNLHAIFLQKT
jgi:hypothetical protein